MKVLTELPCTSKKVEGILLHGDSQLQIIVDKESGATSIDVSHLTIGGSASVIRLKGKWNS